MFQIRPLVAMLRSNINNGKVQKLPKVGFMFCAMAVRNISTIEVTKNITLISNEKIKGQVVDMKLPIPENRSLVIMPSWLMARKKHIIKYADFYLQRGFDVMNISINPWQLLWPVKGTQLVGKDVLKFLDSNPAYTVYLIHGFSVGGYVWGEVLVHVAANREKYQYIIDKIRGQVWDSMAGIPEITHGTPYAMFPNNRFAQIVLGAYLKFHLNVFEGAVTRHYHYARKVFSSGIVKVPTLLLISKTDPIGSVSGNRMYKEELEAMGIEPQWKCWDDSPHCSHYLKHPEEYENELKSFTSKIGLAGKGDDFQWKAKL